MVTEQQILDALRPIEDPEVHKSIVELNMVRSVDIQGDHVKVEVALTISGCPLRTVIENDVKKALLNVPGIRSAEVVLGTMTDEERAKFTSTLRGDRPEHQSPLLATDSKTEFIAVASGKGGVGKSTVTANLAVALARKGLRVGVIDADIYGFSIPNIFGLGDRKPTVVDNVIIPVGKEGVKIVSMGFFVPENSPVIWRGPMLGKMIRNFFNEVHWGDVDVMLLDLPPGTGDVALDIHQMLPKSKELLVTTPQSNASEVAVRAGLMAKRTNHEILGVIENMSYLECGKCGDRTYVFGQGGGARLAEALQVPLLQQIPLGVAANEGTGIFAAESSQGKAYAALADDVAERLGQTAASRK
ncbi:Mrp/NBP35 family ATP-binding protein [Fodinisporobacter ferrooxydans]|uniref:Iron-sulfur cluster carrier protein n=1 Tax=Fodinisporobacter ferrooxydans TaxID=2901836 RepID=A0ABY4CRS7_9BACL|nr:Mrp/NBP35 family ATP-binding protein [Alicyclobacillaceae bacterium MYW30-H2]